MANLDGNIEKVLVTKEELEEIGRASCRERV